MFLACWNIITSYSLGEVLFLFFLFFFSFAGLKASSELGHLLSLGFHLFCCQLLPVYAN